MTKTWKWTGIVSRQEIKNVQKSKVEGKGKKAKRVVAEEEVFIATIERETDGSRIQLRRREEPFDPVIGEAVMIQVTSSQTTLDEAGKKGKA